MSAGRVRRLRAGRVRRGSPSSSATTPSAGSSPIARSTSGMCAGSSMRCSRRLTADFDGRVKIFRQHRDLRFSRDKSPYKLATYGVIADRPGSDAALYAQLTSSGLFAGSGCYRLAPDQLQRYRERAAGRAGAWLERADPRRAGAGALRADRQRAEDGAPRLRSQPPSRPRAPTPLRRRRAQATSGEGSRSLARTDARAVRETWKRLGPMNAWLDRNVGAPSVEPGP